MALGVKEALRHAYGNSLGMTPSLHVYLLADCYGGHAEATLLPNDPTFSIQYQPSGESPQDLIEIGDIVQIAGEDMLVTAKDKTVHTITVQRGYAGTTAQTPGTTWGSPILVWKNFTDRFENEHGIQAVSAIERSFERTLNAWQTSSASIKALNKDRFWNATTKPFGFSSFSNRFIRFYVRLPGIDHRAFATMMIDTIETDHTDFATLSLKDIGFLLKQKSEASSTRQGREWLSYCPTPMVVKSLLERVPGFLFPGGYNGTNQNNATTGIPLHWRQMLHAKCARTISLPSGERSVSAHGRPNEWGADTINSSPNSNFKTMERRADNPFGPLMDGSFPCAYAWDPQVTGQNNVYAGNPDTVGRLYFGVGMELWEFDPITREAYATGLRCTSGGVDMRIQWLAYNAKDTSAVGKPKIVGAAWNDYPDQILFAFDDETPYNDRILSGRLFRYNGGGVASATKTIQGGAQYFYPGTYFFRDGSAQVNSNRRVVGANNGDENLALPFTQQVYGRSLGAGEVVTRLGIRSSNLSDRLEGGADMPLGMEIVSPGLTSIDPLPLGASSDVLFHEIRAEDDALRSHTRFTYGQQGCVGLVSSHPSQSSLANTGAIVYCEVTLASGIVTVKMWEPESNTTTTLHTFSDNTEQPCCIAYNGGRVTSSGAGPVEVLFIGTIDWNEAGPPGPNQSIGKIYKIKDDFGAATTYYDATNDTFFLDKYYMPLWMCLAPVQNNSAATLVVTMFRRDQLGKSDAYGYAGLNASSASIANFTPQYESSSILHALAHNPFDTDAVMGMDTAGRLVRIDIDDSAKEISQVFSMDRSFCPIDGESWSAGPQLAPFGEDKVFGISSPVWPGGNEFRGGVMDGMYILWKLDDNLWDTFDLGYFEGQSIEEALADVAFASNAMWGFDARGDFVWKDRVQNTAPVCAFGNVEGQSDRASVFSRKTGYREIENAVEITPWQLMSGRINVQINLTPRSTLASSAEPVEVQSPDGKQKKIVLTCISPGRVGVAKFKVFSQSGTYKTFTLTTYPAGIEVDQIVFNFNGYATGGPFGEDADQTYNRRYQIPFGSTIRLPDGQTRTLVDRQELYIFGYGTRWEFDEPWTPAQTYFAGSPIEIDLEVATKHSDYEVTEADADGTYVLTSSYDWQEIGFGKPWATGCLIRFSEPNDDGGINYNETAYDAGLQIIIECEGRQLVENSNAKITVFDGPSIQKHKRKTFSTRLGRLPARKIDWVGAKHLEQNKDPRWITGCQTIFAPYLDLFDVTTVHDPKQIPDSPFTDDITIRKIRHDWRSLVTTFEGLGSTHD